MTKYDRLRLLGSLPFGIVTGAMCAYAIVAGLNLALVLVAALRGVGASADAFQTLSPTNPITSFALACGAVLGGVVFPISYAIWLRKRGLFRSFPIVFAATVLSSWLFMALAEPVLESGLPDAGGIGNVVAIGAWVVFMFGGLVGFFASCIWIARKGRAAA